MPTTNYDQQEVKPGKSNEHAETNTCHLILSYWVPRLYQTTHTHSSVARKILVKRQWPLKGKAVAT